MFDDRRKVLAWVHLVSALVLLLFIGVHYLERCCFELSAIEAFLVFLALFNWFQIRRGVALSVIEYILMLGNFLLFSALFLFESLDGTGIYWVAGYPFIAYFIYSANRAKYWCLIYIMGLLLGALLSALAIYVLPYSEVQIYCLAAVVLSFSVLAHLYKSQIEFQQQRLAESNRLLEAQQKRLQVILDHSPAGIWMVDNNRRIQFLNRAWAQWFGVSEQQARQAEDYSTLLSDELGQKALESDRACLESDEPYLFRDEIACVDGELRVFDVIKVKVSDSSGEPLGVVGFAIDITDKLKSEEEQRELERQVQHSQRLESLGIMAGGVAHDFNNLLTAIQGSIELVKMEESLNPAMQESLDCIDSAAHAATDLCKQMLAYSGRGLMKTESFDLLDMVGGMQSLLDVSVGKHITLHRHSDGSAYLIRGDKGQISQVLLNLVINAAEAIGDEKRGEISLSLSCHNLKAVKQDLVSGVELQAGCYVVATVEDSGCGMEPEVVEHMFDPFFTTKFTGRGLGLSAILGILRAHAAGLNVKSAVGVGTSIEVWLPCDCEGDSSLMEKTEPQPQPVAKGRVLVVDDEQSVATVARRMLEKLGHDVVVAESGMQAVEIFSHDREIDWVLLDVTMPEMDGVECLHALREIDPAIYVTMSSGYDAESALKLTDECQPDDFLSKPYTFNALRKMVEKASPVPVSDAC
ncbi:response regulator [Mariprofundus sp. NF]|nr:response regulator [Mariprofundus sp. NF]